MVSQTQLDIALRRFRHCSACNYYFLDADTTSFDTCAGRPIELGYQ